VAKLVTIIKRAIVIVVPVAAILVFGYISNIIKLVHCDFKPSYKAEILRGAGIIIVPMGIIEGFLSIKDGIV
jgi:hypothetical protein